MLVQRGAAWFAQWVIEVRRSSAGRARWCALCAVVMAFCWGCRSLPVEQAAPTVEKLEVPRSKVAQLETGRTIYTSARKCARCHHPKPVVEHTPSEWTEQILPRMARNAKLTELEREYLTAYVLAACEVRRSVISTR